MQKRNDGLGGVDEALFLAIDEAVDQAVRAGGAELQSAGFRTSPHEYFSDASPPLHASMPCRCADL